MWARVESWPSSPLWLPDLYWYIHSFIHLLIQVFGSMLTISKSALMALGTQWLAASCSVILRNFSSLPPKSTVSFELVEGAPYIYLWTWKCLKSTGLVQFEESWSGREIRECGRQNSHSIDWVCSITKALCWQFKFSEYV